MNYDSRRNNRRKFIGLSLFGTLAITVMGLVFSNVGLNIMQGVANSRSDYSLTLDDKNAVGSAGDHTITSATGGKVDFTYTNLASSSGNHTKINQNGTVVNKDQITSIDRFTVVFSGSGKLMARDAYVASNDKWSEYYELASGTVVDLSGTHPYFLEFKAVNGYVNLTSLTIGYTCTVNPDAQEQDTSGSYDITFDSSDTNEITTSTISNYVASGSNYISAYSVYKLFGGGVGNGIKFGSSSYNGYLTLSTTGLSDVTSVEVFAKKYGTDGGNITIEVNGGGEGKETSFAPSSSGNSGTLDLPSATNITSITVGTSSRRGYITGITFHYGSVVEPGVPEAPRFAIGFAASDGNKNEYTTNSIFSQDNALNVELIYSDN